MDPNAAAHPVETWATGRCLATDLGLDATVRDAKSRTDNHQLLRAFVEKRSQNPAGQEPINLESAGVWYTLHGGRWRGVTWHQVQNSVVWLAGAGYHRDDSRVDAYAHVRTIDLNGQLRPSRTDFNALDEWRMRRLASEVQTRPDEIVEQARAMPGAVVTAVLAGRIHVRVVVEDGDPAFLTVAIRRELLPGPFEVPKDWVIRLLAAFFSGYRLDELSVASDLAGEPLGDEHAYCYFDHPADDAMSGAELPS